MIAAVMRYFRELWMDVTFRSSQMRFEYILGRLFPDQEDRDRFRDGCLALAQAGATVADVEAALERLRSDAGNG